MGFVPLNCICLTYNYYHCLLVECSLFCHCCYFKHSKFSFEIIIVKCLCSKKLRSQSFKFITLATNSEANLCLLCWCSPVLSASSYPFLKYPDPSSCDNVAQPIMPFGQHGHRATKDLYKHTSTNHSGCNGMQFLMYSLLVNTNS